MVSNLFQGSAQGPHEPEILKWMTPDESIANKNLERINSHFLAICAEFDRAYVQTHNLGTPAHIEDKEQFMKQLASDLARDLGNTQDLYTRLDTAITFKCSNGRTIEISSSTGFDGEKPNVKAAEKLHHS